MVGQNAISRYQNCGPTFGGGCDLKCQSNGTWCSRPLSYYSDIDIPFVIEYEIFQVIKK
jgi:hypothetical protein